MHLYTLLFSTVAFTSAVLTAVIPEPNHLNHTLEAREPVTSQRIRQKVAEDLCFESTFNAETTDKSPKAEDCLKIAADFDKYPGKFEVAGFDTAGNDFLKVMGKGTCNFGIKNMDGQNLGRARWYIGSSDIRDIVNDAVKSFQKDGKVGVFGRVGCKFQTYEYKLDWKIYSS